MNWRRWIPPGLAVTIIGTPVAVFLHKGEIEQDLSERVTAALAASGQGWATASASAQDIVIAGRAPAPESQQTAVGAAQSVPGVRVVVDRTSLLPVATPYLWSARRVGRQITIGGSVPSDGARAAVLAAARRAVPQGEIIDKMDLARGAPTTFLAATVFALARLPTLSDGIVTLTDSTVSASGTATDQDSYAAFRIAFAKDAPAGVDVGSLDVLPPKVARFVWSANVDSASVTLAGNVPSEALRQTLNATVKATLPGLPLVDSETVASGEPPGFGQAAIFAVAVLQRLQRGGVTLDGLSLDIAGDAKSVEDYAALLSSLSGVLPDGMKVASTSVTPAAVSPYVWQAEVNGDGKLTLTGYVSSADRRTELAAAARAALPTLAVDDRTRIARGEPRMDWVGAAKFAMGQLALLGRGTVTISDTGYVVAGEARDAKAYSAILDQNAHPLPSGLLLKTANVFSPRVSPFRFAAERRDGKLTLTGYVTKDEDRQAILAAALRAAAGTADVSDSLTFASGAPPGFVAAATAAVRSLTRMAGGKVDVVDQSVAVSGTVYQEAAVREVDEALREGLPVGFSVVAAGIYAAAPGQPLTAAACRDQLLTVLKAGRIEFDASNPIVTTDSLGALDRVAGTVLRCPDAGIEIGVHSENDGSAAAILRDRTQARAEVIVDYLAGAGVRRERLTAVGYGATKPLADNNTAAGKAANRRVEFTVTVPAGG
jgi:OOP family OmpA-OmpF porin